MSLIACSECGSQISDKSSVCPNCGCPTGFVDNASLALRVDDMEATLLAIGVFILCAIGSSAACYYYFNYANYNPALKDVLFNVHVPLGLISYSAIIGALISSIFTSLRRFKLGGVVLGLQGVAILAFLACILSGAKWSANVWGHYWYWEPRQTWSMLLFIAMLISTVLIATYKNDAQKAISVLSLETSLCIFVITFPAITHGLHDYVRFSSSTFSVAGLIAKLGSNSSGEAGGMVSTLLVTPMISMILGLITAFIAKGKGYKFVTWWVYGFALFLVSLVHAVSISSSELLNKQVHLKAAVSSAKLNTRIIDIMLVVNSILILMPLFAIAYLWFTLEPVGSSYYHGNIQSAFDAATDASHKIHLLVKFVVPFVGMWIGLFIVRTIKRRKSITV